jgi:hypothetical protein
MIKKEEIKDTIQNIRFSCDEFLILEKLEYSSNMILEIQLVSGSTGPSENLIIGDIDLGQVKSVVRDPTRKTIIRFFQPLTFQRIDESFAAEKNGIYTGERFRVYSDSEYLHYYSKISFGIIDKPINHYSIICSDDIIHILSVDDPEIEIL